MLLPIYINVVAQINRFIIITFCLGIAVLGLSAQESTFLGYISRVEGSGFSIYREGVFKTFDQASYPSLAYPIFLGDMLQTNADTSLEIQTLPGTGLLRVGENTSLQIPAKGASEFKLLYGRLQVQIDELFPVKSARFSSQITQIPGINSVFTLDQFLDQKGRIRDESYVFAGELQIQDARSQEPSKDGSESPGFFLVAGKGLRAAGEKSGSTPSKDARSEAVKQILVKEKKYEVFSEEPSDTRDYWTKRSSSLQALEKEDQSKILSSSALSPEDEKSQELMFFIRTLLYKPEELVKDLKKPAPELPQLRVADTLAPLELIKASDIQEEIYFHKNDPWKTLGITLGISGLLINATGVVYQLYGQDLIQGVDANTISWVLIGSGAGLLTTGLISYFIALYN